MGVLDSAKAAFELAKKVGSIDLQKQLIEVQEKILELQQENSDLKEKIKKLEDLSELEKTIVADKNAYWKKTDEKKQEPYCTACFDSKKQLIRLHWYSSREGAKCPVCDAPVLFAEPRVHQQPFNLYDD